MIRDDEFPAAIPPASAIGAARNWYWLKAHGPKARVLGGAPDPGKPEIGPSAAQNGLRAQLDRPDIPDEPPVVDPDPLRDAIYPYTRDVQLANQGIGYGETIVDVLWERQGNKLVQVTRWSRRTKSGRQVLYQDDDREVPARREPLRESMLVGPPDAPKPAETALASVSGTAARKRPRPRKAKAAGASAKGAKTTPKSKKSRS